MNELTQNVLLYGTLMNLIAAGYEIKDEDCVYLKQHLSNEKDFADAVKEIMNKKSVDSVHGNS